jgi:hypothetical protein
LHPIENKEEISSKKELKVCSGSNR